MTRRALLGAALAALAIGGARRGTYGRMTVDRWWREGLGARRARVLLDGRDITDECFEFDDRELWALLLLRNPNGRLYLDASGQAAARRARGRVEVV